MLEPNYVVLIAPNALAGAVTPAWVDVSQDLQGVQIDRGSPSDLDRNNPGTASVLLDNWSGDYDNENADSPYAGGLVPMTPILIYAEYNGDLYPRFRGFFDQVALDYPGEGMATATITATDGFKPLAQTVLPAAFHVEVLADTPARWWRLDEAEDTTLVYDAAGDDDLTLFGTPTFGSEGLVSRDPGSAMTAAATDDGAGRIGPFGARTALAAEIVFRRASGDGNLLEELNDAGTEGFVLRVTGGEIIAILATSAGTVSLTSGVTATVDETFHALLTWNGATAALYVNGTLRDSDSLAGTLGPWTTGGSFIGGFTFDAFILEGLVGDYQHAAVYDTALSATRAAAHAEAVSTPWNNDTPAERAHRVADFAGWPAAMRDFDTGDSTLQSADIAGVSVLEHLQKIAETDMGAVYISLDGTLTFRAGSSLLNRAPRAELGDADGEVGYRSITFDASDETMRNPVTVSRAEGLAQTVEDTSGGTGGTDRYLDHQYTLDGLLHDDDTRSRYMAELLVSEYRDPQRRIVGLGFGPAMEDSIDDWYPMLLEAELGDVYDVTFRPPNVVAPFTQRSVLEGPHETWTPAAGHAVTWDLSPALGGDAGFWQLDVTGHTELDETTRLYI